MKKVKMVEPKGLRVLLEVVSQDTKVGNLYIPTLKTNQVLGKIMDVGKEILDRKIGLKKDDIIIFKVNESSKIDLGDRRDIRIVNYYDILAHVELEEEDEVVSANFEDDKNNVDIPKDMGNGLLNDNIESRQKTLGLIKD